MQKLRLHLFWFVIFGLVAINSFAQVELSLEDVVQIARTKNLSARKAYVESKSAYWNFQIHKSNLRPQLRLNTQLADFSMGTTPVSQEDGTIEIKTINQNSSNASISLLQPLPFLGAQVFMTSYLYRFDNFSNKTHSYSSQPLEVGLQLPVLKFSQLKWDKRIEPILYQESQKEYDRELELSAFQAVELFFRNLSDRHEYNMANFNMEINTELYRISEEKFKTGRISKDELLQIQLMMTNARKSLKAAKVEMENSSLLLLTHLSLSDVDDFIPVVPALIPDFSVTTSQAIELAINNNPESISFKRRLIEADQEMARTKGATGITGDISATMGYGSNFDKLADWNQDLSQHANLRVELSIPIIDWGRTHAARKKAEMKQELEQTTVQQEQINFEKEIIALVNIVEMLKENIQVETEAKNISAERYEIAYKRYLAGDLSILELNMAQNEKDIASRSLLSIQGNFWVNYFRLRIITLYDFITQTSLVNVNENNIKN